MQHLNLYEILKNSRSRYRAALTHNMCTRAWRDQKYVDFKSCYSWETNNKKILHFSQVYIWLQQKTNKNYSNILHFSKGFENFYVTWTDVKHRFFLNLI